MYESSANLPFSGIAIIDLNSFVSITSSDSNFEPSFPNKTTLPIAIALSASWSYVTSFAVILRPSLTIITLPVAVIIFVCSLTSKLSLVNEVSCEDLVILLP